MFLPSASTWRQVTFHFIHKNNGKYNVHLRVAHFNRVRACSPHTECNEEASHVEGASIRPT